jgi:hypothetical protein
MTRQIFSKSILAKYTSDGNSMTVIGAFMKYTSRGNAPLQYISMVYWIQQPQCPVFEYGKDNSV